MKRVFISALETLFVIALLVSVFGCNEEVKVVKESKPIEADRLTCIANLYCLHQIQHMGYGPLDRAELEKFITKQPARSLKRIGVDPENVGDLFVSENDGEPFEIRYGVVTKQTSDSSQEQAIVLESAGVNGTRRIALASRKEISVSNEAKYQAYLRGTN